MLVQRILSVFGTPAMSSRRVQPLVWVLLLACAATSVHAQQFHSDPVDKASRQFGASAKQWVGNPQAYSTDKARFDDYFNKYYFPDMTHAEDVELGRLGKTRYELFSKFLWATNNQQLQQDLTAMALKRMTSIVTSRHPETNQPLNPPYHPAVRYNAVLVLGLLDEQYPAGAQKSKPLPAANALLTKIVSSAADDKPVPPPLVLGALIGLERHGQLRESLPPQAVADMTAAIIKLVLHEKPIQEMDPEAYAWIRVRAAEALSKMGGVGDKNNVHDALLKLIASSKSLDDRCEVAGMLDRIAYKDVKLDDANTALPLFALARDVATAEDKRAADFQSQYSGGTFVPSQPRMTEFQPGGLNGEPIETYPRRTVLTRLSNLRAAVTKVKPSLPTETQKKADELLKAIEPATKAVAAKETTELKMAATLRTMAAAINKAVPAPTVEKAPPAKAAAAL